MGRRRLGGALLHAQLVGAPIRAAPTRRAPEVGLAFDVGGPAVTGRATAQRRAR